VRVIWSEIAQATFVRFMADQDGMMAVNRAVAALADDPAPPDAFVRGAYRRLRTGPYRVLYEVEGDLVTIVRVDRVS
jgi:plasmid stabilization system protein ParE